MLSNKLKNIRLSNPNNIYLCMFCLHFIWSLSLHLTPQDNMQHWVVVHKYCCKWPTHTKSKNSFSSRQNPIVSSSILLGNDFHRRVLLSTLPLNISFKFRIQMRLTHAMLKPDHWSLPLSLDHPIKPCLLLVSQGKRDFRWGVAWHRCVPFSDMIIQ